MPPLRQRDGDIDLLVDHFVARAVDRALRPLAISAETRTVLRGYAWPGNVRELEHVIERAAVLVEGGVIEAGDLPPALTPAANVGVAAASPVPNGTEDIHLARRTAVLEGELIQRALARAGGDLSRAAALLGIQRSTLHQKIRKHKLTSGN